ncbi:hypothetical protein JCM5353_003035 [Sporobolomyces roseus]
MRHTLPTELISLIIDHVPLYGTCLLQVREEERTPDEAANREWIVFDPFVRRLAAMEDESFEMIKTLKLSERPRVPNEPTHLIFKSPLNFIIGNVAGLLSNVETLVLNEEPSASVMLGNLKALEIAPQFLKQPTWDLLDQTYHPNLQHVHLDLSKLEGWTVMGPSFVAPRLETFEMNTIGFPYTSFSRLLGQSTETLRQLRIPLTYIPSFELTSFSNLTELTITDIHILDNKADVNDKFFDRLPQLRNLKTLSVHDVRDFRTDVAEATQLASSLPPSLTRVNLPGMTLRAIVIFFSNPRTNGIKVFGCDLTPRLEDAEDQEDVTVLKAFCKMRGIELVDIPDETPPWSWDNSHELIY